MRVQLNSTARLYTAGLWLRNAKVAGLVAVGSVKVETEDSIRDAQHPRCHIRAPVKFKYPALPGAFAELKPFSPAFSCCMQHVSLESQGSTVTPLQLTKVLLV